EPAAGGNARFTLVRAAMPVEGNLEFYMDGRQIAAGPVATISTRDRSRLVLEPDDITLSLLKEMRTHAAMVATFPGEERGVEFRLDQFGAAWQAIEQSAKR
ncbi:MAG: hypothetical protein NW223_15730, partial [Hyphomicrobiaceae bacterium]|nr:hypothetical protein [Hyphomicrobiaceae bacterium]